MKQHYFVKFSPNINQQIGCSRATLILSTLEYWSRKKPDGFFKFIEPCAHRLYKMGDSWAEQLGCDAKTFSSSFKKIGIKYSSRTAFESSHDKFQGKMWASYYDRYSNLTFFIRNHEVADAFFSSLSPTKKIGNKNEGGEIPQPSCSAPEIPVSIRKNSRSYIESKNTSNNLSKDKSHASDEMIIKMIEIYTALVEQGKSQIELTSKRIAFLKKALTDKFDNCLDKWKKFCESIASSKFLMGEIKPFRATLDWVLKFETIQKILEGCYGIGDRNPIPSVSRTELYLKTSKMEIAAEEEEIRSLVEENETIKVFRLQWLTKLGAKNYREYIKDCGIVTGEDDTLILHPSTRYKAKSIASYWTPAFLSEIPFSRINIFHQEGELVFDKWFGEETSKEGLFSENKINQGPRDAHSMVKPVVEVFSSVQEEVGGGELENNNVQEWADKQDVTNTTLETKTLRSKLKDCLSATQFPSWLGRIEVEDVKLDGTLVIMVGDSVEVDWCQSRYSHEILQCAQQVWEHVKYLVIREKPSSLSSEDEAFSPYSVEVNERFLVKQAVQSLLAVCPPQLGSQFY